MGNTLIIAEAGVNHNGDVKLAKEMIKEAKKAGADYIKFQTFIPEKLVSRYAAKAEYQKEATRADETQLQMLQKLALSQEDFIYLKKCCEEEKIGFISTPFDLDSIDFLETLDMDFWKIPSGELTNYLYLRKIGKTGRKVILSTGMSDMREIQEAIDVLQKNGTKEIILLHCNTQYPTPMSDVNLLAMEQMRTVTKREVGYSDHTEGIEVPIAAVALGAIVIEKHFTLDKNLEGPDHKASLEPTELKNMVTAIRNIEKCLGDGVKRVSVSEKENIKAARKSVVALKDIECGEVFSENNLTVKRPGTGISPMCWENIMGTTAKRDFMEDELIEL